MKALRCVQLTMHNVSRESWQMTTSHRISCHWSSRAEPEPTRSPRPDPTWTHVGFHTCNEWKKKKKKNCTEKTHLWLPIWGQHMIFLWDFCFKWLTVFSFMKAKIMDNDLARQRYSKKHNNISLWAKWLPGKCSIFSSPLTPFTNS